MPKAIILPLLLGVFNHEQDGVEDVDEKPYPPVLKKNIQICLKDVPIGLLSW